MFENFENLNLIPIAFFIAFIVLLALYIRARLHRYMSELAENEKKFKELTQRFEYALSGTGDGLWDWDLVTNDVYFSPAWKEMLGYSDSELPNEFSSWETRVHPDDLEIVKKAIQASHSSADTEYNILHRMRHKDGSWVWILDRGQTIFDADNKAVRMVGFHTDISTLKEQELKIEELSRLLRNTIDSVDNLIFVKDSDFKYIEFNEAFRKFTGLSRDEILGKDDYDLFDEEVASSFRFYDKKMLAEQKQQENYEWVKYPDGSDVYLLTLKAPLYDKDANVVGLVGNCVDLTREELLKDEIAAQEDMMIAQSRHAAMGEMISMLAHQWRQPLSIIAMNATNIIVDIELESLQEADLKETAKSIINQTQELSKTIDDFKDFFKPDKVSDIVLLNDIVTDALGVIGKNLKNNAIELQLDISQTLKLKTYARELMQVLIHILKNAIEAFADKKAEKKIIWISMDTLKDSVILRIEDNAGGIDDAIIDKIFDPYFSTKPDKNGTGLGLYMSKTIVDKHLHGSIKVKKIGNRSCFEIKLPLDVDDEKS